MKTIDTAPDPTSPQMIPALARLHNDGYPLAVGAALLAGLLVRLLFILRSDFPLNDGGLFYIMVRDLQEADYALPTYTSYNSSEIPFAYPPLGFYLAGLFDALTGWGLLSIFRFVPLAISILSIAAFARFGQVVLASSVARVFALFAFAFLPMSFLWVIMGGGLTRSLGLLFAVLALHQAYLLYTTRRVRYAPLAIIWATGTVLSHPEAAWFVAYSSAIMFLCLGRNRLGLINSCLVAVGTLALTAPWWATIVSRHGAVLFRSFGNTGVPPYSGIVSLVSLDLPRELTQEPAFPLIGTLALFGALVCLRDKQFFLPVWLGGVHLLQARAGEQKAIVPLALLAGIGAAEFIALVPLLTRGQLRIPTSLRGQLPNLALTGMILFTMLTAARGYQPDLVGLPQAEREAMRWAAANTPPGSRMLLITSAWWWGADNTAEWFPALSERTSVAAVQGHEWLGGFAQRITNYETVQSCASQEPECLDAWAQRTGATFTHVYVAKKVSAPSEDRAVALRSNLNRDPRYVRVYDGPGATIFRRAALSTGEGRTSERGHDHARTGRCGLRRPWFTDAYPERRRRCGVPPDADRVGLGHDRGAPGARGAAVPLGHG